LFLRLACKVDLYAYTRIFEVKQRKILSPLTFEKTGDKRGSLYKFLNNKSNRKITIAFIIFCLIFLQLNHTFAKTEII
jgi:hypothetical protein